MRLYSAYSGEGSVLLLHTGGAPPKPLELGLCLCRSLTIGCDRVLAGPLDASPCPGFLCLDVDGSPVPAASAVAAAFLAVLRAEGYPAPETATDGETVFFPPPEEIARWTVRKGPEGAALGRLLGL